MSIPDCIEIVCGTDANYAPHLGVLLRSIRATNRGQKFRVHVLHDGVGEALQQKVARCAPDFTIQWYGVVEDHQALAFEPLWHITRATYLRLTMAEQLDPAIGRVLFLDADMIVNASLLPLWTTDLQGKSCAAVVDPGIDPADFAARFGLKVPGQYFNAGVLLLDMRRLREENAMGRAVDLLADKSVKYDCADQDALNIILWNDWIALDPAWNFQWKFLKDFAAWRALSPASRKAPLIVHYTQWDKPWLRNNWHPYAWFYLRHLLQTPFRREVLRSQKIGPVLWIKWWLRMVARRPEIFVN